MRVIKTIRKLYNLFFRKPPEDQFLGFINRLVNTGYTSSKIALNRIEKATKKRKEFGKELNEFLSNLPSYHPQRLIEENQIS